jgi:hypothetical protein
MSRIGINPSRSKKLNHVPERVTVAVLVYAPDKIGYFQNRLDVTRLTINSILQNTRTPFNFLIYDNGSCDEMVDYLKTQLGDGKVDTLILSNKNIGKLNALNQIFRIAPSDVIAYTDDDVYHLPGWLEAHLNILDTYPNVGAVTGFYIKQRVAMSSDSTIKFVDECGEKVKRGNFIPQKWELEYMENSGRSVERYNSEIQGIEDIIVSYRGVEAWVSAHHFQFVSTKQVMQPIFDEMLHNGWSDQLMGRMVEMDDLMDSKGYLRLTTYDQKVMLLGNTISSEMVSIAKRDGLEILSPDSPGKKKGLLFKIANMRVVRKALQAVLNLLFTLLNDRRE